jgi:hypothetical protein
MHKVSAKARCGFHIRRDSRSEVLEVDTATLAAIRPPFAPVLSWVRRAARSVSGAAFATNPGSRLRRMRNA